MSKTPNPRALDRDEADMVEQTKALAERSPAELRDLIGRLRARRNRVQRQIRGRVRAGESGPDAGAREKKALLTDAIARVADEMDGRKSGRKATTATDNLRDAVRRKAESPTWTGPDDRTADLGPSETPNTKIAPSGALHAEGMRAAIARSTGAR
ncbi:MULTISPECIES: hypothetical protein [unclassified Brevundimonas]|uniref:hypothetical protein n=1 Tax=unclassified Brevundimonas TaxID=2622653 RepID=UPI0006FD075B|nr:MULTISPECIES: hypothetical protein [unclassified Brevundimonas]KQR60970.1 hypothetical protein ASF81_00130 [Brevundimonas sp. Leaf168]